MTSASKSSSLDAPPRYRPIRELGSGGGEVWEVEDRLTGTHLALKLIVGHGGQRETDALIREVVALSGLEGLGLPRVMRFGRLPRTERVYMLREMVDGRSLDRVLSDNPHAALVALAEAADQLTVLHRAGLLHGDIKPANIIVRKEGGATLVDLGLVAPWVEQGVSPEGLTPRYAAPELLQGRPITVRAEIFSLGLVLDEILEQKKAKAIAPSVMEALRTVATAATNFEPSARYPSTDEFAAELRRALGSSPSQGARSPTVGWPILGIDTTAARLLLAISELPASGVLQLVGPEGSGRSALLRRLAWSLGIAGVSLVYLDEVSARIPEAALMELSSDGGASLLVCLCDDADELCPEVKSRLSAIRAAGGKLVLVGTSVLDEATTLFSVPPLSDDVARGLMRRAIPSLTDEMVARLIEASGARPGVLRGLMQRVAAGAAASLPDLERLLEKASPSAHEAAPPTPERIQLLLDRGRYRDAAEAIAAVPAEQADSPRL